jgi:hypothetical protein
MRAVDVASALGARSPYTWLALPVVDDLPEVLAATTLPVLLRPDAVSSVDEARQAWGAGLALTGARGLVLPAGALYPDHGDELALVEAAAEVVHEAVERGRGR